MPVAPKMPTLLSLFDFPYLLRYFANSFAISTISLITALAVGSAPAPAPVSITSPHLSPSIQIAFSTAIYVVELIIRR